MKNTFTDLPIVDAHIHFGHLNYLPGLMRILDENQVQRFNIVCTPSYTRLSLVPDALFAKGHHPGRVFVFGGLDISALFTSPEHCGAQFAENIRTLTQMGCDGIKMIEGKPDMRKILPIPAFDSPAYAPYWQALEESGVPLLFHVNDPEEFWDPARIPDWARRQGWYYGDGTFINNEAQYTQVLNVLARHPRLKIIFAHFFFMSAQLPRLADLLERFPNICIDLTPGIEMYHNFSRSPQATRDFFVKYQDRILFGTDIGARALLSTPEEGIEPIESALRIRLVRSFLERQGAFRLEIDEGFLFGHFEGEFIGLGLPEVALQKIYAGNFERLAGTAPRPLDPGAIIAECQRLRAVIPMVLAATQPGTTPDLSVLDQVKTFFTPQ